MIALLPIVALGLAGFTLAVLTLAIAGRRDPARVRCAGCRRLLDARQVIGFGRCEHCHADLSPLRALVPRWSIATRSTWIMLAAVALLWPLLIWGSTVLTRRVVPRVGLVRGSPATLLDGALRDPTQGPMASQSLQMQLNDESLSTGEARTLLLAALRAADPASRAPQRYSTLEFVNALEQRAPLDGEVLDPVLDFVEPVPSARVVEPTRPHASGGFAVALEPVAGAESVVGQGLPIATMLLVRRLRVDGEPAPLLGGPGGGRACTAVALTAPSTEFLLPPLGPGRHAIELDLEACVIDAFDLQRYFNMQSCVPSGAVPPEARRVRPRRVTIEVSIDDEGRVLEP